MKIRNETKIGLMVILVVAILAAITIKTGKINLSKNGYRIKVLFKNIDGVNLNSPVMLNGFEVGVVEDVQIINYENSIRMELTVWLQDKAKIMQGSKAYIKNLGFLGEKFVGLTSGMPNTPFLTAGAIVIGEEPPDFDKIVMNSQEIVKDLKSITKNIDERLEKNKLVVDDILVNLNSSLSGVASILENVDTRLVKNQDNIDDLVGNIHSLSVNLEELSYDLKINPWKLLYRPKIAR